MLKKKNIAMIMAAATVATSVAPVFAAVKEERIDEANLIAKVTELLNTRYSDAKETGEGRLAVDAPAHKNSVYKIYSGSTEITSVQDLKKEIEDNKVAERPLVIDVVDKGHKEVNGRIVATEDNKYNKYDGTVSNAVDTIKTLTNVFDTYTSTSAQATSGGTVHEIALKSGVELELTEDSYVLDLNTGLDGNGNEIDLTNGVSATVGKRVVGFKKDTNGNATAREMDLEEKHVSRFVLSADIVKEEIELSKFTTEFGYNEEGKELSRILQSAVGATGVKVTKNGKEYTISNFVPSTDITKVKAVDGRYEFTITLNVGQKVGASISNTVVDVVIKSEEQPGLEALQAELFAGNLLTVDTTYTTLAGDDRFDTAISISKATFGVNSGSTQYVDTNADSVVLVGEDAIVDGLSSAPLAKAKNAPILLAKKDSLTANTVKEIKRVFSDVDLNNTNSKTIYIVGGESVISKNVEKQLLDEMNVKIVRLSGDDRVETSLEIAKELDAKNSSNPVTKAYVVGADGEADAMSIASIASNEGAPIIVTPANGVTKDTLTTLALQGITTAEVIGGESKVSTNVMKDLKVAGIAATRIAGETRQETNAKVIDTHNALFTTGHVFVAKDGYVGGNGKLIDALAVAPLAAHADAPIILTTEELTKEQTSVVEAIESANSNGNLVKVGNGISSKVIKSIVKLLNL